jgi:hypothetical protein
MAEPGTRSWRELPVNFVPYGALVLDDQALDLLAAGIPAIGSAADI